MPQQVINGENTPIRSFLLSIPDKLLDSSGGIGLSLTFNFSASALVIIIVGLLASVIGVTSTVLSNN